MSTVRSWRGLGGSRSAEVMAELTKAYQNSIRRFWPGEKIFSTFGSPRGLTRSAGLAETYSASRMYCAMRCSDCRAGNRVLLIVPME
jgi:hypothetical protein